MIHDIIIFCSFTIYHLYICAGNRQFVYYFVIIIIAIHFITYTINLFSFIKTYDVFILFVLFTVIDSKLPEMNFRQGQ